MGDEKETLGRKGLREEIKLLKKEGKVKEPKLLDFYKNVKNFLSMLCNHLLAKMPLQSQFAKCWHCPFYGRLPIIIQKAFQLDP